MRTIVRISTTLAVALLCGTACDRSSEITYDSDPAGRHSIAWLKGLCSGASAVITQDITVQGTVTANDLYGEFYKMLVVEDNSGGISIAADHTQLYADYPAGTLLTIHCNGLTLTDYGGKIQLGATPDDGYGAGRIPRKELDRYLRREGTQAAAPRPTTLTPDQITARHIDTYVRLDGVHFTQAACWCDTDPATQQPLTTERLVADAQGRTFLVRTAATCIYAKEPVPYGTGSLCGIIDYFSGKFTLRVVNREAVFANAATLPTTYL